MPIHYIQDQDTLTAICAQYAQSPVLTIDTEFVRTRTLYPKLGLLQVSNGDDIALIDPIVIDDLTPFWALLTDASITKVLHACSEDLEVFLTSANCKPVNLIDSQVMMSFLGHGLSMGYAAMVNHYLDIELDKSESRTDWTKRPLSDRQLAYAQADVKYLFEIYPIIAKELEQTGWLVAAQQETQLMIERKFTPIDADEMYRAVKMGWRLNPKQLNRLKLLATWRYQQAQQRDLPISFIAKDNTLMALAQHNPRNVGTMAGLEGAEVLDVRHKGKAMLNVLKKAEAISEAEFPEKIIRLDEYPSYKQTYKKVKSFIADVANSSGLTPENLASKKQVNQFLSWHFKINNMEEQENKVDILLDWRLALFGEKLLAFANNGFK
ncbi:ribonuclease D [Thalassotalea atypica]|uniref:ribonuclease D n=1 Tax=Thalassotalea atypica TaxID=2054316 RepID=UPI002572C893|nr:ribonuclease D [Thalassotalea atypica]